MKLKKVLLPFIAGALALSLAACGDDDKAEKEKAPQEETGQEATKEEKAAAEEMQKKLVKQQVDKKEIVAIVNDEELKGEEYNDVLMSIQDQMQQQGQDPSSEEATEQLKGQTLDTLVNQTLILQKAKEAKIKASESEIDEEFAAFGEQFGDAKEMKKALKEQDMDEDTLKAKIAELIVFDKYQEKVAPPEKVSEKEIKEYYDQAADQSKESGQKMPPLEEVSKEIQAMIEQQQQQEKLSAHVKELKESADIELKI